jgi:hypothetical protein
MTRRQFIAAVTLSLVAAPVVAEAQQPGKVYRLGILTPGLCSSTSAPTTASVLPLILREMGYVVYPHCPHIERDLGQVD